jgi:hypothetical protein
MGTLTYAYTDFTAYTRIKSSEVNSKFQSIKDVINGAIENVNISASAAIARSKLASGTASHVLINDGSGVVSSEATLSKSRGGAGADMSGVTFPSSGSLYASGGTDVAIVDGGTGQSTKAAAYDALNPNTTLGDLTYRGGSNNVRLPIGTSGQVLSVVGGAPSWAATTKGLKNYVTTNADLEGGDTSGFSLGHAAVTSGWLTGAPTFGSGAAGTLSLASSSSSPLAGSYSLLYSSTGTTTVGDFVSTDALTLDPEAQGQVLGFKIAYSVVANADGMNMSGTSSNTFGVGFYDVTNSVWLQPAGVYNLVQKTGVGFATGTLQIPITCASIRMVLFNANATTINVTTTLKLDDFFLGPQVQVQGAAISDPVAYTPVFTGLGTVSNASAYYQVIGKMGRVYGTVTTGTVAASLASISLPSGWTIDTMPITNTTGAAGPEVGGYWENGFAGGHGALVTATGTSTSLVYFGGGTAGTGILVPQNGSSATASTQVLSFDFMIPLSGKSSNTVMSSDTDTRAVAARAYLSSAGKSLTTANASTIAFDATSYDTHGGYNPSTGEYTVPVSGKYTTTVKLLSDATTALRGATLTLYKNATVGTPPSGGTTVADNRTFKPATTASLRYTAGLEATIDLVAGDKLSVAGTAADNSYTTSTGADGAYFEIRRLAGPATIAATESVNARYRCTTADTVTSSNTVNYDTKDFDSHNAVTTSATAWKFTAPVSGTYRVTAGQLAATTTANTLFLYKNGSADLNMGGAAAANVSFSGSGLVKLLAGEYVDIRNGSGTSLTLTSDTAANYVCIERVGN